jgi:hypothetical protein
LSKRLFGNAMLIAIAELRHHRRPLAATRPAVGRHTAGDELAVDDTATLDQARWCDNSATAQKKIEQYESEVKTCLITVF